MKIDFFNVDDFCEHIPAVTTNKIYAKKGFHPNGLFSEKIFGPTRTCTCGCGIYWGRTKIGERCKQCGVEIGFSSLRRTKYAKIELPFKVINPIMLFLIFKVGKSTLANLINNMIFNDSIIGIYYNEETKKYVEVKKPTIEEETITLPDGVVLHSGIDGIFNVIKLEAEKYKDKSKNWNFIYENLSKFFMNNVIVCPPEFRPVSKTKDVQMRDKLNEYYMTILNFSIMLGNDVTTYENSEIQHINFKNLQRYVNNLYDFIFSKFSKKEGLIRGSILGKRIDFSARAVISPEPSLELDQCSIPYVIGLELFKLKVVNRLLELKKFNDTEFVRYDPALKFVNDCIKLHDYCLLDIVKHVTKDKLIMLNRQPTLHRMGILSFKVLINTDHVIKIHPCVCEPYNADFDGDQMAAYISLYDETEEENKQKIYVLNNLVSPSTGKFVLGVNQDILLGLYLLTKENNSKSVKYDGPKKIIDINGLTEDNNTFEGRILFNSILPDDFPFINKSISKKELNVLIDELIYIYDSQKIKEIVDKIKDLGLKQTTQIGVTFSLKDLKYYDAYDKISEVVDDPSKTLLEKFHDLHEHPYKEVIKNTFPYSDFIESGSRGSWDQANQLIFCKGYMSNSQGQVVETPIKNNLINGLTSDEFFISCYGSRKALLDVALNTAVSGYLTRKLVYCNINLELNEELDDCGTEDYLTLKIPKLITDADIEQAIENIEDPEAKIVERNILYQKRSELDPVKLCKSLIGRWIIKKDGSFSLITKNNYSKLYGKTIHLRSPIYCKSSGICKKCYGETYKYTHSKYIGVLSAQALGEVATQLTLRTFHTGGKAMMEKGQTDSSQKDIINDLAVVNRLFHNSDDTNFYNILINLFSIYSRHRVLLLIQFECVIAQMMRIGNLRWRLHPDRSNIPHQLISIGNIPSKESFLLALAFSKPYNYIVQGILGSSETTDGILEKILINNI